jgi:hypothetical protein
VTPDNERQAWREAVRAFRLAATMLKNPAPGLFADIAIPEEALRNLTQELPLVSFSPFGALPGDIAYGRGEPPHRPASLPSAHITEHQATRPVAQEPAVQPPVFSFRQSNASDVPTEQRQQPRSVQGVPRESTGGTTADGRDIEMDEHRTIYPMTLLNGLAEDALRTVEQGTPDVPVRRAGMSTTSIPSGERTVPSREPGPRVDHGADYHTPPEPGSPRLPDPVEAFPDAAGSGDPDLPVSSSGDLPELDPEGNSAVALIDSLAEQVLVPEARIDESLPASRTGGGGAPVTARVWEQPGQEADLGRSPFALSDGAAREEVAGHNPPGSLRSDPNGIAEETFARNIDAETLAALVNDVLVRQARRHGVDLS